MRSASAKLCCSDRFQKKCYKGCSREQKAACCHARACGPIIKTTGFFDLRSRHGSTTSAACSRRRSITYIPVSVHPCRRACVGRLRASSAACSRRRSTTCIHAGVSINDGRGYGRAFARNSKRAIGIATRLFSSSSSFLRRPESTPTVMQGVRRAQPSRVGNKRPRRTGARY